MVKLSYRVTGDQEVITALGRFGTEITDLSQGMNQIGDRLTDLFGGQVFASRGGAIGQPWQPLASSTVISKARRWAGRPPLVRTGLMQRSFVATAGRMRVEITNRDPKFAFHQQGTRHIPARTMMAIDRTRETMITRIIEDEVTRKMKGANV